MKDPLEIMGAETIFVMGYYSGNVLEEYENMNKFKAGLIRKKFKLPYSWDGTGAVVYGQHLYYNRWSINFFHIGKHRKYISIKRMKVINLLTSCLFFFCCGCLGNLTRLNGLHQFDIWRTTICELLPSFISPSIRYERGTWDKH